MSTLFPCIDKPDFVGCEDSDSPGLDSTMTSEDEEEEEDLKDIVEDLKEEEEDDNCGVESIGGTSAGHCNTKRKPRRRMRQSRESVYDEQTLFNESREENTFLRVENNSAQEPNSRFESLAIHNGPHYRRSLNEFNRDTSPTTKNTKPAAPAKDEESAPSLFPPIMAVQFDFESGGIPLQPDFSIDPAELHSQ